MNIGLFIEILLNSTFGVPFKSWLPPEEEQIFLHFLLEVILSYLPDLDLETTDWEYPTPAYFTSCSFSTTFQFSIIHVAAEAMTS